MSDAEFHKLVLEKLTSLENGQKELKGDISVLKENVSSLNNKVDKSLEDQSSDII